MSGHTSGKQIYRRNKPFTDIDYTIKVIETQTYNLHKWEVLSENIQLYFTCSKVDFLTMLK